MKSEEKEKQQIQSGNTTDFFQACISTPVYLT